MRDGGAQPPTQFLGVRTVRTVYLTDKARPRRFFGPRNVIFSKIPPLQ